MSMNNVIITRILDSENGDRITFSGYHKDIIKEMKRTYRRDRATYAADTKTWTVTCSTYQDQSAADESLIQECESQGATVIIDDRNPAPETAEEILDTEEIRDEEPKAEETAEEIRAATPTSKEYGVRWQEFNAKDQLVVKEKFFVTAKARVKFIEKILDKANFDSILATSDPAEAPKTQKRSKRIKTVDFTNVTEPTNEPIADSQTTLDLNSIDPDKTGEYAPSGSNSTDTHPQPITLPEKTKRRSKAKALNVDTMLDTTSAALADVLTQLNLDMDTQCFASELRGDYVYYKFVFEIDGQEMVRIFKVGKKGGITALGKKPTGSVREMRNYQDMLTYGILSSLQYLDVSAGLDTSYLIENGMEDWQF